MSRITLSRAALVPLLTLVLAVAPAAAAPDYGTDPGAGSRDPQGISDVAAWRIPSFIQSALEWLEGLAGTGRSTTMTPVASQKPPSLEISPSWDPSGPQPQAGDTIDPDG